MVRAFLNLKSLENTKFLKVLFGHLKLLLSRVFGSQEGQCCGMYLCPAHLQLTEEGIGVHDAENPRGLKCSFVKHSVAELQTMQTYRPQPHLITIQGVINESLENQQCIRYQN